MNNQNLKSFTSTYRPKNPGRKPNHLKKYLKETGIGTADIRVLLGSILTDCKTIDDVKSKITDPKTPPIILFPLRALLADMSKGKLDAFSFLMRYAYGEPKQEIESKSENIEVVNMSFEEREKLKTELLKKLMRNNPEIVKEIIANEENNPDKM